MSEQSPFQPPDNNKNEYQSEAQKALEKERQLPLTGWQQEVEQGLEYGLEAAESIKDRTISTFSRGELPLFAKWAWMQQPILPLKELQTVRIVFGLALILIA